MTNKIQINLRLEENVLKQLDQKAKEENRPRNNLIEHIIKQYLAQETNTI